MKVRSKAPLRLGIAGGGTDVSPYSDEFGGCVLNASIDMYAHVFIDTDVTSEEVFFEAKDLQQTDFLNPADREGDVRSLPLHKATYRRVIDHFNDGRFIPLKITTYCDAPPGSGLGSSSTMVVAMLEAYRQLLGLPLGEYDLARLAFEIERVDCSLSGGKQDQYAATFGGFNFMEFFADDRVIVNPLRMRRYIINELEASLILFFTGASRDSAKIIQDQVRSLNRLNTDALVAMHKVKETSYKIKELVLKGDIEGVIEAFRASWLHKKATSQSISNAVIDEIETAVMAAGAKALKVSGAGGGGFMMIFVDPERKLDIEHTLQDFEGTVYKFKFVDEGASSWTI